ncbi:MAG: phage shock protein operon transcriptional activator [Desulfovibrio sp.]|nr:MAG: phage shock protein operon transcriptional activator [Desulfovibrio sp.]
MCPSPNSSRSEQAPQVVATEALGRSEAFLAFSEHLALVAKVDRPVLLIGEPGTGKELAATRLHFLSQRWSGPMVTLNCAALAPSLQETELFGHEAGAFTGAVSRRQGRFELAHNGTLFLDEIGNMDMALQEKILRAVEYSVFERVGGVKPVEVDVRIVGATNVDLPARVKVGEFKGDLLDRLSFEVLTLPPLREREEDIMLLAERFAASMAVEMGLSGVPEFSDEVHEQLMRFTWPGNVRQLKNVVERAVYRAASPLITELEFDPFSSPFRPLAGEDAAEPDTDSVPSLPSPPLHTSIPDSSESVSLDTPLPQAVADLEIQYLREALHRAKHKQTQAAKLLGLTYDQFRGLYRKHHEAL